MAALVLALGWAGAALAAPPQQWAPVDQAVADLDPLATSLRRVETGLRSPAERDGLYQVFLTPGADQPGANAWYQPAQRQYYRVGQGYRLRLDRMDYLIPIGQHDVASNIAPLVDGQFAEVIPANAVFEINPIRALEQLQITSQSPRIESLSPRILPAQAMPQFAPNPNRLDRRLDGRIDARIDGHVQPQAAPR